MGTGNWVIGKKKQQAAKGEIAAHPEGARNDKEGIRARIGVKSLTLNIVLRIASLMLRNLRESK
jgi:hypothetical protein